MKNISKYLCLACFPMLSGMPLLTASDWSASVESFRLPGSFSFTPADLGFRFVQLTGVDPAENQSTHLIVQGLRRAGDMAGVHFSHYSAVNIADGSVSDTGAFYVTLPGAVAMDAPPFASAIVGVVPRAGPWENFGPTDPPAASLGGATGIASFDNANMALQLSRAGANGAAIIPYSMGENDEVDLSAFSIVFGGATFAFGPTRMVSDGSRLQGFLSATGSSDYDALFQVLRLAPGAILPPELIIGEWVEDNRLGMLYGAFADWAYSPFMGWLEVGSFPWLYHPVRIGWMTYLTGMQAEPLFFYNPDRGFLYVGPERDGTFLSHGTNWAQESFF